MLMPVHTLHQWKAIRFYGIDSTLHHVIWEIRIHTERSCNSYQVDSLCQCIVHSSQCSKSTSHHQRSVLEFLSEFDGKFLEIAFSFNCALFNSSSRLHDWTFIISTRQFNEVQIIICVQNVDQFAAFFMSKSTLLEVS